MIDISSTSPFTFTLDALMPNAHNPRAAAKTIKKLLEQRDEARELLAKERASPLLQELQETKRALEAAVKVNLDLSAELARARDAAFHATADYRVSVESYEKMITDLKIDHAKACADAVAKFESYEKQLEEIRAAARVDDVNLLKKRLAAKAEELRLMVIDRDQFKVAALANHERARILTAEMALIPEDLRKMSQATRGPRGPR